MAHAERLALLERDGRVRRLDRPRLDQHGHHHWSAREQQMESTSGSRAVLTVLEAYPRRRGSRSRRWPSLPNARYSVCARSCSNAVEMVYLIEMGERVLSAASDLQMQTSRWSSARRARAGGAAGALRPP